MILYILTIELFLGTSAFSGLAFESYKDCKTVEKAVLTEHFGNVKKARCREKQITPKENK